MVSWKTHSEAYTSVFKLERSANGNQFYEIGEVPAAGFSSITREYLLHDRQPLHGLNYYRLKMLETDGRFQHSAIVKTNNKLTGEWNLLKNPAKHVIGMYGLETGDDIVIISPAGQRILQTKAKGHTLEIPVTGLPDGLYFIKVNSHTGTSIRQVVISH